MEPFLGEIRTVGFGWAPVGWQLCNGQLLSIAENDALFNLIGTTYGGDGISTFGVPDLRGRVPVHQGQLAGGSAYVIGDAGGAETVTLVAAEMPSHSHQLYGTSAQASQQSPAGNLPAAQTQTNIYGNLPPFAAMAAMIQPWGGGGPHDNMHPFGVVNFVIATQGIYPSQG